MKRLREVPLYVQTATLTLLNAIFVVLITTYSLPLLTYTSIPALILIALIGYVSGKSLRVSIIVLELITLLFITLGLSSYVLVSKQSLIQTVTTVMIVYVASLILSTSFLRNIKMDLLDLIHPMGINIHTLIKCLIMLIGITSLMFIISGIILINYSTPGYITMLSIITTLPYLDLYALALILTSYALILMYLFNVSKLTLGIKKEFLTLILGATLLLLSPISLPLFVPILHYSISLRPTLVLRPKEVLKEGLCDIVLGEILDSISDRGIKALLSGKSNHLCMNLKYGDNNHTLIIGATGTGKTSLAKAIVEQAVKQGYRVVIIDAHGEYVGLPKLVEVNPKLNPIDVVRAAKDIGIDDVVSIIADTYRLGDVQKEALRRLLEILLSTYENPCIDDLLDLLNKLILLDKEESLRIYRTYINREVLKSLIPYIRSLKDLVKDTLKELPIGELLNRSITINVSRFAGSSLMRIYIEIFLRIMFNEIIKSKKREMTLLIVEEFHNYVSKYREGILGRILREGRKFGINVIAITQGLPEVSDTLLNNFKWVIIYPMFKSTLRNVLIKLGISLRVKHKDLRRLILNVRNFEPLVWNRDEKGIYHIKAYIRG